MLSILTSVASAAAAQSQISVRCSPAASSGEQPSCHLSEGVLDRRATAFSTYNKTSNLTTGFATLDIHAAPSVAPRLAAFAAGYAEGFQTAAEIAQFYTNVYEFGAEGPSRKLTKWVTENDAWTRAQAEQHAATDDYWQSVATVLDRFDGMLAGYEASRNARDVEARLPSLNKIDFLWINLDGDLFDLQNVVGEPPRYGRKGRAARFQAPDGPMLRCSALFKLAAKQREIFFGHATWDTYATAAPRVFKHLTLPVSRGGRTTLRTVSMSSSPGFLASIDDYYLMEDDDHLTTLGVIETSINIDDHAAYKAVKPQSVLCWVRSMVANQLALDAPGWAAAFGEHASGTYNNQWMVLDIGRARASAGAGKPLAADSFWVLEEVPGLVHAEDQSDHLNTHAYWPSFNEIYYPATRKVAGARGNYSDAVRFRLFAELQGSVTSDAAMARVIAWNDYQHDPIAHGPSDAISMRGDLVKGGARAGGGIDAKYSTLAAAASGLVSHGRAGPTNDDQPPFCWTEEFAQTPHVGHPRCFGFQWGSFAPARKEAVAAAAGAAVEEVA